MKVSKFNQKGYTVSMELEAEYKIVEDFMEESFKEVVSDAVVPGFRKGKVPRAVFEKNYGTGIIIERASNKAMNKMYLAALDEKKIKPVDYPKNIEVKKLEEGSVFAFSLEVDVEPEVKLGKYKGLKIEKKETAVDDKAIEIQIDQMRENYAEYDLVEGRSVQKEDIVSYDLKAFISEISYDKWTKQNSGSKVGSGYISEDFDKNIEGMKVGEKKEFSITFKDDHYDKEIAGKEVKFEVLLNEIREKKLPELNDEFVAKVSPFKTVVEFKKDLIEKMEKKAKDQAEGQLKEDLLQELLKSTPIDLPEAMREHEINRMVANMEQSIAQSRISMDDYLKIMGKDMKGLREELKDKAADRVKINLLLQAIAAKEEIAVSEEDLDKEITKIAETIKGQDIEESKKRVSDATKDYVKSYLQDEKTIEFLQNHAKITQKS